MIPVTIPEQESFLFPVFRPLLLSDRDWFRAYVKEFPPYSDFNFVSLYSYDTEEDAQVSFLHGNLVVKFRHYLTNEPFYTFIGNHSILETVETLLSHASGQQMLSELQLIPEFIVTSEPRLNERFQVQEDRDNHDYVLHLPEIATLPGNKFANKRNLVNRFTNDYPSAVIRTLLLPDSSEHEKMLSVFSRWVEGKQLSHEENDHEKKALRRLLSASEDLNVVAVGIEIEEDLKGYAIGEQVDASYGLFHFVKGDPEIRGISEVLYKQIAILLLELGCEYMNFEQDLGIPGLRIAKEQWNPVHTLKKYTVRRKEE